MKQVKQLLRYPVVLVFFLFLFGYTLFDPDRPGLFGI